jgi:5-(carboxyamino)imidazole ribonucleotide synthase
MVRVPAGGVPDPQPLLVASGHAGPGRLPPPVPRVVGIVGGGQLARMTHQASIALGIRTRLLAASADDPAALVVPHVQLGRASDVDAVVAFGRGCDVVTFDHEGVPQPVLRALTATGVTVAPGADALLAAQDKAVMRERLTGLGVACPRWSVVPDPAAALAFAESIGAPVVLKVARGGYDGHGVWLPAPGRLVPDPADPADPADAAGGEGPFTAGVPVLAEERVDFTRELSALVVRSVSGQAVAYPVVESVQRDGICVETVAPAPGLDDEAATGAQAVALRIAGELGVVGVLAVELFQARDGRILVNELAMRPHNTGHWTIDGAVTSQFENHLRAVTDLPLGSPAARDRWSVMVNVLGGDVPDLHGCLLHVQARDPGLRVHLYDKPVRPGRKVGHVTVSGDDPGGLTELRTRAWHAADYLAGRIDG